MNNTEIRENQMVLRSITASYACRVAGVVPATANFLSK